MTACPPVEPVAAQDFLRSRGLIFDHLYDGVVVTSLEGLIIDWNAGAEQMFGWRRDEVLGKTPGILHRPEDATLTDLIQESVVHDGRWVGEITFLRKDGSVGVCETVTVPLCDENGTIYATVGVNRDLTARKMAEAQLEAEHLLLRTLIDAIPDPIFFKDRSGKHLIVNTAKIEVAPMAEAEQAIGRTVWELPIPPEFARLYAADDELVTSTGEPIINREEPFLAADGSQGWFLTSKYPLCDANGTVVGLVGIARDITQRKRAEAEIQHTRQRLIDHVENSPLAVIEWSPDFRITRWAGQAEHIFGWTSDEVMGRHVNELPLMHPAERARVSEIGVRLLDGRDRRNVSRTRNLAKSGAPLHCVWHNSVLHDEAGRPMSILSLVQDVTEQIHAEESARASAIERQAIERKLQEAQKLESLGVLAGGIAHDFNNLLTGILGNSSLLVSSLKPDSPEHSAAQQIELASVRAAELAHQMLAYSGRARFNITRLNLNEVIEETLSLVRSSFSKKANLVLDLSTKLPAVMGDATQLRQVVMNLVINAGEAIGNEGTITVRTDRMDADREYLDESAFAPDLKTGEYAFIEVRDTGCGMPPEVRARIFDPFFTTKFTGRGLGLAAVLGIVRGHNGALHVESEQGRGSCFRVLLPASAGDPTPSGIRATGSPGWSGKGTVLIVDDEETVRMTAGAMLERLGFRVLYAGNGANALEVAAQNGGPITLVLLDMTMPGMDTEEICRAIHRLRPSVRILLMSGYSEHEVMTQLNPRDIAGFLQKPFRIDNLRNKLQELLAANKP